MTCQVANVLLALLLLALPAFATNYYVDNTYATNGDGTLTTEADTAGGAGAFNSIANMMAKAGGYAAGDGVWLKRGLVFRETLQFPSSGEAGNPITIGAYSTGANPIINGSTVLLNAGFNLFGGTTYATVIDTTGYYRVQPVVWEDDVRLTAAANAAACQATPGTFFYIAKAGANDSIYVNLSDGGNPITNGKSYEFPRWEYNYTDMEHDYLVFQNIDGTQTNTVLTGIGGAFFTGQFNIIQDATLWNHRRHCFTFYNSEGGGDTSFANGCIAQRLVMYDNVSTTAFACYYSNNNILRNCTIDNVTGGAVIIHGKDATHRNDSAFVHFNTISGVISGNYASNIWITNNTIRHSAILPAGSVNVSDDSTIYFAYNLVMCDSVATGSDVATFATTPNATIANNTFIGKSGLKAAVRIRVNSTGAIIKNNIFYDVYRALYIEPTDTATVLIDNNNYYSIDKILWGASDYGIPGSWATYLGASGRDTKSFLTDPSFKETTNYKLKPASPCIDKGAFVSGIERRDLTGYHVMGKADIGCNEFGGKQAGAEAGWGSSPWNSSPWNK